MKRDKKEKFLISQHLSQYRERIGESLEQPLKDFKSDWPD
jgi:hypothetical protein